MELAELLEKEGLDADEVLAWARARADELLAALPADLDLDGLLRDMPKLEVIEGGASSSVATTPVAASSEAPADSDLLGDADEEFEALNTGSFDIIEEGDGAPLETHDYDTGPLPAPESEVQAAPEDGAPAEEVEVVESGDLEEIDDAELEEIDDVELVEFASGEYEMVEDDGEEAEPSRPPAPPSKKGEEAAPEELSDPGSFDIDLDI